MVLQVAPHTQNLPVITWEALPDDFALPDDPVENLQQPLLAAALNDALDEAGWIQPEMLIASNFALVANLNRQTIVKAPDWVFVPRVNPVAEGVVRRSYTPRLQGEPVAVVMEFLSETETGEYSIRPRHPYGKLFFYEQVLRVPTYIIFDAGTAMLEVRQLREGTYAVIHPNEQGHVWIPEMSLYIGVWQGTRLGVTTFWLRWWDKAGNLLLWGSEHAEAERQRAEVERQRAEAEHQRAEAERQRAEGERQRANQLAAKLRELGVDPDTLTNQ